MRETVSTAQSSLCPGLGDPLCLYFRTRARLRNLWGLLRLLLGWNLFWVWLEITGLFGGLGHSLLEMGSLGNF